LKRSEDKMERNEQQKSAIFSKKPFITVSAGAGSGKTSVLTERYRFILEESLHSESFGANVKEIVALTFTEKAAREMRNRIRSQIENKVQSTHAERKQFWMTQLQDFEQATISTFHSFCMKLLKDYSFEANVYPDFSLMDDLQSTQLKNQVINDLLEDANYQTIWQSIYSYYSRNKIKDLVISVYGKMREFERPVQNWLSGANWLDQSVLEQEVSNLEASIINQIKHFRSVAEEYRSDFPSPETITRASAVQAILKDINEILDSPFSGEMSWYLSINKINVPNTAEKHAPALYQFYKQELLPFKEDINNQLKQVAVFKKQILASGQLEKMNEIMTVIADILLHFDQNYTREKRALNVLDFSDLQQKAISLLEHEHIQQICREQYKHFLLDEFQDTNHLQMSLLDRINPTYQFIVGDGKQSIYRFRGADVGLIKQMSEQAKMDNENAEYINLFINYRTCSSIIDFVNLTFQQLMKVESFEEHLPYKIQYEKLESARNGAREQENRVELYEAPDKDSEYQFIANRIVEMKKTKQEIYDKDIEAWRKIDWHDIAILIPTRTNLLKLERELQNKNIPYKVYGGLGFYDQPEVRDMIMLLQWLNRPFEELYIFALLKSPLIGLTLDDLYKIKEACNKDVSCYLYQQEFINDTSLSDHAKQALMKFFRLYQKTIPFILSGGIKASLRQLFENSGLETICLLQKNNVQRLRNVEKLIEILAGFNTFSLEELLNRLAVVKDFSEKEGNAEVELTDENSLHIMTVHASKGLEFPIVFVTNLNGSPRPDSGDVRFDEKIGLVAKCKVENEFDPLANPTEIKPSSFSQTEANSKREGEEEWKRLFYVAVTRARDYLVLTGHGKGGGSWLDQLNRVMEMDSLLLERVQIIETYQNEGKVVQDVKEYELPVFQKRENLPVSFSVSEVMSFIHDPSSYYMKHILKLDINVDETDNQREYDEWSQDKEILRYKPAILGTLVHRACEMMDLGTQNIDAITLALSEMSIRGDQQPLYIDRLTMLVNHYEKNQTNLGDPIANEWRFNLDVDGVYIIGDIDKVVKKDNDYHVIDLKTNYITEDTINLLLEYYKPQLYLYKLAYENKMDVPITSMKLFFLRNKENGIYEIPFEQEYENYLKEQIGKMAKLEHGSVAGDSPSPLYSVEGDKYHYFSIDTEIEFVIFN
jgi:ATP-dependent helicase/nuclease subunit A